MRMRPYLPKDVNADTSNSFFERENYCETCRVVEGKHGKTVDCRTEDEVENERKRNINQD